MSGGWPIPSSISRAEAAEMYLTRVKELEQALEKALDVAIWLSGLLDRDQHPEAWVTWEQSMRPQLDEALRARGGVRDA